MGLYFPVNPPMKQDILPHKNVCPMAFYPLNYENRYHPCFQLWIHSRSAAAPKANSQSTRLSDTQNQQGFVGTPLIMHSSVLTTGKGFIRTCCIGVFVWSPIAISCLKGRQIPENSDILISTFLIALSIYCKDRRRTWKIVYSESLIKITPEALGKFELV